MEKLAEFTAPSVQDKARELTRDAKSARDKLARLFLFVRDGIAFGFPPEGDFVRASETLERGLGQCNTKATLLLALCKAAGLSARIHFSLISREIQKGFFTGIAYRLLPRELSHSWIEVEIDGQWRRIDTFINDLALFDAAKAEVRRRGWQTGFSVALKDGEASAELDLEHEAFQQMQAVTDDHGSWDDPADYYASPLYRNRPGALRLWVYRRMIAGINRRVEALRARSPA